MPLYLGFHTLTSLRKSPDTPREPLFPKTTHTQILRLSVMMLSQLTYLPCLSSASGATLEPCSRSWDRIQNAASMSRNPCSTYALRLLFLLSALSDPSPSTSHDQKATQKSRPPCLAAARSLPVLHTTDLRSSYRIAEWVLRAVRARQSTTSGSAVKRYA